MIGVGVDPTSTQGNVDVRDVGIIRMNAKVLMRMVCKAGKSTMQDMAVCDFSGPCADQTACFLLVQFLVIVLWFTV